MKKIFFSVIIVFALLYSRSFADQIYIPAGGCIIIHNGSSICVDTVFVDSLACLMIDNSSCICPGTKILGTGSFVISTGNNYSELPKKYGLFQNYPNPFNPVTIINYELPITNYIRLVIYDVLGKEIEVLVDKQQAAGNYQAEWDASNYPSGVYFYKLAAGDYTETKKMILVK